MGRPRDSCDFAQVFIYDPALSAIMRSPNRTHPQCIPFEYRSDTPSSAQDQEPRCDSQHPHIHVPSVHNEHPAIAGNGTSTPLKRLKSLVIESQFWNQEEQLQLAPRRSHPGSWGIQLTSPDAVDSLVGSCEPLRTDRLVCSWKTTPLLS